MGRQNQQLTYNSFSGGLITEASPLTFPDGASIDESNFELTKQGYRSRRLGMDAVSSETSITSTPSNSTQFSSYLWNDVNTSGNEYLVLGVEGTVLIYDVTDQDPGESLVYQTEVGRYGDNPLSFAAYAGKLVIANGSGDLSIIRSIGGSMFSESTERLYLRDLEGIPDYINPDDYSTLYDLRSSIRAGVRPSQDDLYYSSSAVDSGTADVTFNGSTKVLEDYEDDDGDTITVYQLSTTSGSSDDYMGYPVESYFLRSVNDSTLYLYLTFREPLFKSQILDTESGEYLTQHDGLNYRRELTTAEWNSYLNASASLSLQEVKRDFHPHFYNLWNQGWGSDRMEMSGTTLTNPITYYYERTGDYPSMADAVNYALYADTGDDDNRTAERFWPDNLEANPPGSMTAARGHYIIDAMSRSEGRLSGYEEDTDGTDFESNYVTMHEESTTTGAQTIAEYAGRIFYAGFTGDTPGSTLPLSNKVLYSQTTEDSLFNCYQEADPTSTEDSSQVATDGGYLTVAGLENVVRLVAVDTSLLVFASNGVWVVSGDDGNLFSPLSSRIAKITDKGAVNSQSIVVIDSDVFYWAEDGIYHLTSTGYATFSIESLTKGSINDFIKDLSGDSLYSVAGAYDERLERIVWLVEGDAGLSERRELIYHLLYGAFTVNTYYVHMDTVGDVSIKYDVLGLTQTPLFEASTETSSIIAGADSVLVGEDSVVVPSTNTTSKFSRIAYIGVKYTGSDDVSVFFANNIRTDFKDWGETDAEAYLLTGYVTGGDTSRQKGVSWLTSHFNRTETTATEEGVEDESSCYVQSQWDWTNNAYANKWGKAFQAYRLPRPQIRGIGEQVAEGIEVVTTKSKLRGRGRVVSLKFYTEEEKDCQLLGWSMIAGVNNNV